MTLKEAWEERALDWARWARPEHDYFFRLFNFPAFLELLPPPGRRTLDVGCGEGRVGAELVRLGHRVTGVEQSPTLARLAAERHEAVNADAASLPFEDASFDLALAFMCLHDMDDMPSVVRETARVLEPGGRFCVAITHPLADAGAFADEGSEAPFVVAGSYFERGPFSFAKERDGLAMTYHSVRRPLEDYVEALAQAGFLLEALREPVPPAGLVAERPRLARQRRVAHFLHLRGVRRGG